VVFNINSADPTKRELVAAVKLENGRPSSYMHAMGYTSKHMVIVAQPMHLDLSKVMRGNVVENSMYLGNGTLFTVVNRQDGTARNFPLVESFFFGHICNTWEEDGDIYLDLTYYIADENLAFLKLFERNNFFNKTWQKDFTTPKWRRFRLTKDGRVEQTPLLPDDQQTILELPTIDERKIGKKYCIFYSYQSLANAYDEDKHSKKVGPAGTMAIAKRNLCTGERSGFYGTEEYPSEPKFIPRPGGIAEDDGVLVGFVYNASGRSSFVQILDAKSMVRIATAQLPVRTHFFFHSSFFPSHPEDIVV
jgi:torulene dioxygenase